MAALAVVLKLSPVHVAQVRLAVLLPPVATAWPGTQLVHEAQVVAGLPSWSQVSLAQACLGVVPPAQ